MLFFMETCFDKFQGLKVSPILTAIASEWKTKNLKCHLIGKPVLSNQTIDQSPCFRSLISLYHRSPKTNIICRVSMYSPMARHCVKHLHLCNSTAMVILWGRFYQGLHLMDSTADSKRFDLRAPKQMRKNEVELDFKRSDLQAVM